MLTNSRLRKKKCNLVLLERNYVEVSTWKMAAILTATVTTSFASLLAALPLGAWGLRYTTLAKNAEREKLEEEFVLIAPSWENFNFHTCCCCCWTAGSKVGKSLSDHHHNLLEVKIDALLGLQLFSAYSLFYLHRKAPGKVPWNWLALVSRLHDTSILEVEREEAREAGRKKKSPILMGSNADRKRRENCPQYRNLKYFQLD